MYNNRLRFINFILAPSNKLLIIGTTTVYIKGHRTASITIECKKIGSMLDSKRTFILYNIAYIPSFITNVIYYNRFYNKGIF